MVLNKVLSILSGAARQPLQERRTPTDSTRPSAAALQPKPTPATPVYPPGDSGIQFYSSADVLESQAELIKRLRLSTGVAPAEYEALYGRVIERLADAINLLPATESDTHQGAGGLFRLALEMGFYALQASEATIFAARAGVERRRLLEPRWRYASWLAGLCAELYRPVTTMIVTTADGDHWPTYRLTLGDWLREKGADRYYVRWLDQTPSRQRPGRGAAASLAHRIIPDEALQYMHEGSLEIVPTMLDVITGVQAHQSQHPLPRIIEEVREKVIARDTAIRPQSYGRLTVGQHTEPHLLDAMRRLVKSGKWTINIKKSRLWFGDEGLFLIWPTAANEMLTLLRDDGVAGIPKDTQTILDILAEAGIVDAHHDGGYFWSIYPPLASTELAALKLSDPKIILGASYDEPESAGMITRRPSQDEGADSDQDASHATLSQPAAGAQIEQPSSGDATPSIEAPNGGSSDTGTTESGSLPQADKSKQDRARNASSGAAAQKSKQDGVDLSARVKEELGKGLDDLTRDVFGALIEDIRAGKITNQAGKVKEGYAISLDQLATYGIDIPTFASEVQKAGWLYTPAEKPNKKIVEVQINGKLQRAVVIKLHVAIDMGFIS